MLCRYCKALMQQQDNDPMPGGYSSMLFVCSECDALFEEWTTSNGKRVPEKDSWYNPKTKDYE